MIKVVFCFLINGLLSAHQVLKLDSSKRIVAKIGKDSMNRISIENDRIFQVFGDAECYEIQTEERTGQIFIKPTQENGTKPLSMTLITENGMTQDLKLIPSFDTASSLVLQGEKIPVKNSSLTPQENLMKSIKLVATEKAILIHEKTISHDEKKPSHIFFNKVSLTFLGTYQSGDYRGYKYKVKNRTKKVLHLCEKDFFTRDEKAIALKKTTLQVGESTLLYIVS